MNALLARIKAISAEAWLAFLAHVNALIGFVCAGIVMLDQTYPSVVQSIISTLTPTRQAAATLLFCSIVQYALRRAAKNPA